MSMAPFLAVRGQGSKVWLVVVAALHPTVFLGLFFSLAMHMHRSLGGWPPHLGTHGFPDALKTHFYFASQAFSTLLLGTFIALPIGLAICGLIPRLRVGLRPLGYYALTSGIAMAAMILAPSPFLRWWWD